MPSHALVYEYPSLLSGVLVKRYKRFFAEIQLDSGELITAHCPNTGPMTGIYIPGMPVQVSYSHNPSRKLPYTWEMVQVPSGNQSQGASVNGEPVWVGVNTALPNRIVKHMLETHLLPELGNYAQVSSEVVYGQERSRIDFRLAADPPIYVEVKNTTWTAGNLALFPDTVTTRGQKHLRELMALLPQSRAVMLYFINRGDCPYFAPGDSADPTYGALLRSAIAHGLTVLPCRFQVSPYGIHYIGLAKVCL
ncbi:MAG: DNA/RNA nuclease SfsA [Cyanobacteria bacterium]|nr:DNA/RNA nuclease SfsA [Cyanobacteriota bacterium]MDW8201250.1 DNA/RNA nuclease SfsA [Cyanobacteriota bacterium SKYGB_h_bin112]